MTAWGYWLWQTLVVPYSLPLHARRALTLLQRARGWTTGRLSHLWYSRSSLPVIGLGVGLWLSSSQSNTRGSPLERLLGKVFFPNQGRWITPLSPSFSILFGTLLCGFDIWTWDSQLVIVRERPRQSISFFELLIIFGETQWTHVLWELLRLTLV